MAHTLEITFDNIVDFNTKFAALKDHLMRNDFNISRGIIKSSMIIRLKKIRIYETIRLQNWTSD